MQPILMKLKEMREFGGALRTTGLSDDVITRFLDCGPALGQAIEEAYAAHLALRQELGDFLRLDEEEQIERAQADFTNFYPQHGINPYVALAARGPWLVTLKGAVVYDAGGYGMLGLGHAPDGVLAAMSQPQVMANVMTPSLSQLRFGAAIRGEIGRRRANGCPFARFMCLNSGSESVSLALRIVDTNAKQQTDPGASHAGRVVKRIAVKGAFHGRTEGPARYSNSTRKAYEDALASFRGEDSVLVVEPYDVGQLRHAFAEAEARGWFIEAVLLEPVMGEGDPGRALTPEFYLAARELTRAHGGLLVVDSIQAGLRAHGLLSIVDYPGFEKLDPPDIEAYSKALNAGQYPLSVLALGEHAAGIYRRGTYGNTMTANPRALDVACAVIHSLTPELRENIRQRGREFVARLTTLKNELPGYITKVQGTGLLFSCELSPEFQCFGADSTEEWMREHGYGVIHGGASSLRFTPHFAVSSAEVELLVEGVRRALVEGPRRSGTTTRAAA